jgi:hypothetical protein
MRDARRKNISRRDDIADLGRMYYQLLQNALSERWDSRASWFWRPDKQSSMDWRTLGKCLVSKKHQLAAGLFSMNQADFMKLKLKIIRPVESHREIFVQVADYFAGLGAYSFGHFERYKKWDVFRSGQTSLFDSDATESIEWSHSEEARFPLLQSFNSNCKSKKLTVSLNSTKGLYTHNPSKPLNFWLYKPQHILDKAPVRR